MLPYQNPHTSSALVASMSTIHKGSSKCVVEFSLDYAPNYTKNIKFSWVEVDIGHHRKFLPNHYTIRHGSIGTGNALRTWDFQARVLDSDDWTTLRSHDCDDSLNEAKGSTSSWPVNAVAPSAGGYRFFRILQCGANSSGNDCLFCGGIDLYGKLIEKTGV